MRGRPAVAPHGFVVLGAGLPRTGTNSLQLALEQLLGGTCYHMKTILQNNGDKHYIFWDKAIKRRLKKEVGKASVQVWIQPLVLRLYNAGLGPLLE